MGPHKRRNDGQSVAAGCVDTRRLPMNYFWLRLTWLLGDNVKTQLGSLFP